MVMSHMSHIWNYTVVDTSFDLIEILLVMIHKCPSRGLSKTKASISARLSDYPIIGW